MEKLKEMLPSLKSFFLDGRFALCFLLAWMITNGWAYIALAVGGAAGMKGLASAGAAYLAVLWMPFTPEKIVTFAIAAWLRKLFFAEKEGR